MIYLVKDNNKVRIFYSENEMKTAEFKKAGLVVPEEKFNSNGCYARLVNGEIVVGRTSEEKRMQEVLDQIQELDTQLESLDKEYLTPRILRGLAKNDEYAIKSANTHENKAVPIRKQREILQSEIGYID
jgi:hypothetical protein